MKREKRPIKLALFRDGPFLPPREGATYEIQNLIRILKKKKFEILLLRCYRGWDDPEKYFGLGIKTIFLKKKDFYTDFHLLSEILIDHNIEIAQFDSPEHIVYIGAKLKKIANVKIVFDVHNIHSSLAEQQRKPKKEIMKLRNLEWNAFKLSDLIICHSDIDCNHITKNIDKKIGIYRTKFRVKTNEIKYMSPLAKNKTLLFHGNNYYWPNENAIKIICKSIAKKVAEKGFKFLIAGPTPKKIINKYQSKDIEFVGEVDKISPFLSKGALAVCPIIEGSGTRTKILDYLAGGVIVITTSKGAEGLSEACKRHLIIEDNIESYPQIIVSIYHNRAQMRKMSTEGRKFVKKEYGWDSCVEPFEKIYGKLLSLP